MSKVIVLNGSPRRGGNTDALTSNAIRGIKSAGAEAEEFFLSSLKIHPCTGCESCSSIDTYCVFDDDMNGVLKKIAKADAILFASPVWWFNISSYLKLAVDRFFGAFMKDEHFLKGKKMGFAFCYGDKEPLESGVINAFRSFEDIAAFTGGRVIGVVHGCAQEKGEILKNESLMREAFELGARLGGNKA